MSNKNEAILVNKRKGFIIVFNDIANNLPFGCGDAILLWMYLAAKTHNWKIIKTHLCDHFKCSMGKLNKSFSILESYGLIRQYQLKGEKGRFGKYVIEIDDGKNFISSPVKKAKKTVKKASKKRIKSQKKPNRINTPHRNTKNRNAENPLSGEMTATKDCILLNTRSVHKKRASAGSLSVVPYPDDFFPDTEARETLTFHAQRTNNSEHELLEKFERVSKQYKTKSNNWQQTFIDYLEREKPKRTYINKTGGTERYDGKSRYTQ